MMALLSSIYAQFLWAFEGNGTHRKKDMGPVGTSLESPMPPQVTPRVVCKGFMLNSWQSLLKAGTQTALTEIPGCW